MGGDTPWYATEDERAFTENMILVSMILFAVLFENLEAWATLAVGGNISHPQHQRAECVDHALEDSEPVFNFNLILFNRLSGEFMVLGFIAFLVWSSSRSGFLELCMSNVSPDDLGPYDATSLLHIMEDVHMALFFAMCLYFAVLFRAIKAAADASEEWRASEHRLHAYHSWQEQLGQQAHADVLLTPKGAKELSAKTEEISRRRYKTFRNTDALTSQIEVVTEEISAVRNMRKLAQARKLKGKDAAKVVKIAKKKTAHLQSPSNDTSLNEPRRLEERRRGNTHVGTAMQLSGALAGTTSYTDSVP